MVDMNKIVGRWHPIKGPIKLFMGGKPIEFGTHKDEGTFICVSNEIWFVSGKKFFVVFYCDENLAILREAGLQEVK